MSFYRPCMQNCGDEETYNPYFERNLTIDKLSEFANNIKSHKDYAELRESVRVRLSKINVILYYTKDEDSFCGMTIRGKAKEAYEKYYMNHDKTSKWRFKFVDYDGVGPEDNWSAVSDAIYDASPNETKDIEVIKTFRDDLCNLLEDLDTKWGK